MACEFILVSGTRTLDDDEVEVGQVRSAHCKQRRNEVPDDNLPNADVVTAMVHGTGVIARHGRFAGFASKPWGATFFVSGGSLVTQRIGERSGIQRFR